MPFIRSAGDVNGRFLVWYRPTPYGSPPGYFTLLPVASEEATLQTLLSLSVSAGHCTVEEISMLVPAEAVSLLFEEL